MMVTELLSVAWCAHPVTTTIAYPYYKVVRSADEMHEDRTSTVHAG